MTLCTAIDADLAALLEHGAKIIPVFRGQKRPVGTGWQHLATNDQEQIANWIAKGNVGICLGHGNLIDIEFDDHPGYESFLEMTLADGTPLSEVETPSWQSARGCHRLFRVETLPGIAFEKIRGVEFRYGGRAAQSVLPPSVHPSGYRYSWLTSPQQCAPALLTDADLQALGAVR
jgi:hypothetical protein